VPQLAPPVAEPLLVAKATESTPSLPPVRVTVMVADPLFSAIV